MKSDDWVRCTVMWDTHDALCRFLRRYPRTVASAWVAMMLWVLL